MSLLSLESISVRYGGRAGLTAVEQASLALTAGRTHGLVGESGSGKGSLARSIFGLAPIGAGRLLLEGQAVDLGTRNGLRRVRRMAQLVFQNPYASLNPRMRIGAALQEAARLHRPAATTLERARDVAETLALVGLDPDAQSRFPQQFSGGQLQRIAIARALATHARVLVLDEVTSALDVSVQGAVLNLLRDLQAARGLSYLFISHDLAAVRHMSHDVSVMYLGRIVETAPGDALFAEPAHPYTAALLSSVPDPRAPRRMQRLPGEIGDPRHPPSGCRFHPQCGRAAAEPRLYSACQTEAPRFAGEARQVACHAPLVRVAGG